MTKSDDNLSGIDFFLKKSQEMRVLIKIFYKSKALFEIDTLSYSKEWFDLFDESKVNDFVIYCTNYNKYWHYDYLRNISEGDYIFESIKERYLGQRITTYAYFFKRPNNSQSLLTLLNQLVQEKYNKIDTSQVNFQVLDVS